MGSKTDRNTQRAKPAEQPDDEEELDRQREAAAAREQWLQEMVDAANALIAKGVDHEQMLCQQNDQSRRINGFSQIIVPQIRRKCVNLPGGRGPPRLNLRMAVRDYIS